MQTDYKNSVFKSPKNDLTKQDKIFISYVLKHYAQNTEGLDQDDVLEIYDIANKLL